MDLSAVIFVVLALAWAGYLIPKALKHHDELAGSRLDGHSDRVRILSRHKTRAVAPDEAEEAPVEALPSPAEPVAAPVLPTRAAARKAARRRRRVLYALALALAVVAGLAWFAIVPWWSTAVPAGLVLVFLVVARLSVRAQQRARVARPSSAVDVPATDRPEATASTSEAPADLDEDTIGIPRQEIEAALADDGALWDPLPLTLPTYVGKAHARRTVRTIELTGISSSGHDAGDSALAQHARDTAQVEDEVVEDRKVAGA